MCVVSAIWMEEMGGAWSLQPPAGYANEQALHDIVMSTPQLLPLSGTPDITVIGREVPLPASGFADVLAVEPDGRPVIIEVKLRNNAESRRAVIAQALSYAASLHGLSRRDFEEGVLARHLEGQSLFDVVRGTLQDEELIQSDFDTSLEEHLAAGSFRVVIVLDEAPPELINLVGYLEAVTTGLSLDLIAVTSYAIGGHRIAVPRRLDPEHRPEPAPPRPSKKANTGHTEPGIQPFRDLIPDAPEPYRATLEAMADLVEELVNVLPAIKAETYSSPRGDANLLPRFRSDNAGLVTLWKETSGRPSMSLWRTVFERHAPGYIEPIEQLTNQPMGQGRVVHHVSPELLTLVGEAYRSATY
jgi:hypothetical protein